MNIELDYSIEYDGDSYHIVHDGLNVTILDCEGEPVISFLNRELWDKSKAFPENMARIALSAYYEGHAAGEKHGYFSCQYDVKKVLGLR